jgi:hypothetical protein
VLTKTSTAPSPLISHTPPAFAGELQKALYTQFARELGAGEDVGPSRCWAIVRSQGGIEGVKAAGHVTWTAVEEARLKKGATRAHAHVKGVKYTSKPLSILYAKREGMYYVTLGWDDVQKLSENKLDCKKQMMVYLRPGDHAGDWSVRVRGEDTTAAFKRSLIIVEVPGGEEPGGEESSEESSDEPGGEESSEESSEQPGGAIKKQRTS